MAGVSDNGNKIDPDGAGFVNTKQISKHLTV
jgi:hypothetical protein